MAIRLVSPLPAMAQDIPNSRVTSIRASCGRQKQFCPGQACSVLYWPMTSRPPRVPITVKSESTNNHRKPNHRAQPANAPTTTVRTVLNPELNRLARSHPTRPVSDRGGGSWVVVGSVTVDTGQTHAMRIRRLYRLPISE